MIIHGEPVPWDPLHSGNHCRAPFRESFPGILHAGNPFPGTLFQEPFPGILSRNPTCWKVPGNGSRKGFLEGFPEMVPRKQGIPLNRCSLSPKSNGTPVRADSNDCLLRMGFFLGFFPLGVPCNLAVMTQTVQHHSRAKDENTYHSYIYA